MTPRQHTALMHWLEYCSLKTQRWWLDGGYWQDNKGDFR